MLLLDAFVEEVGNFGQVEELDAAKVGMKGIDAGTRVDHLDDCHSVPTAPPRAFMSWIATKGDYTLRFEPSMELEWKNRATMY